MKKTGIVNLICSLILVSIAMVAVILGMVFFHASNIAPVELTVSSASATTLYNGEPLVDTRGSLIGGELREGHRISISVTGSQTDVGISENHVSATVLDEDGNDASDQYKITYKPGSLTVKPRPLTLIASDAYKLEDGEPLVKDDYVLENASQLVPGDKIYVDIEGSITSPGETKNLISAVTVVNGDGKSVTHNYSITRRAGRLIVYSEEALVFKAKDNQMVYNGAELTEPGWELISGTLPDEGIAKAIVTVEGERTDVGASENTILVKMEAPNGTDLTESYEIVTIPGRLTVLPQHVVITSGSAHKAYDGQALTNSTFSVEPAYLANKVSFLAKTDGTLTEVGTAKNSFDLAAGFTILDEKKRDVTKNYTIEYVEGTLTVHADESSVPTPLTYRSGDAEKTYDGTPLRNTECLLTRGSLKPGHEAVIKVEGTLTMVGLADNRFTVKILNEDGADVTAQYAITKNYGTLEVLSESE